VGGVAHLLLLEEEVGRVGVARLYPRLDRREQRVQALLRAAVIAGARGHRGMQQRERERDHRALLAGEERRVALVLPLLPAQIAEERHLVLRRLVLAQLEQRRDAKPAQPQQDVHRVRGGQERLTKRGDGAPLARRGQLAQPILAARHVLLTQPPCPARRRWRCGRLRRRRRRWRIGVGGSRWALAGGTAAAEVGERVGAELDALHRVFVVEHGCVMGARRRRRHQV